MNQKTVIIYKTPVPECWGSLKLFCKAYGLEYESTRRIGFPFEFNGYEVHRVETNQKHTI